MQEFDHFWGKFSSMKRTVVSLAVLPAFILTLSGCKPKKEISEEETAKVPTESDSTADELIAGLEEDESFPVPEREHYNPARTKINDVIHTKLEVGFDWANQYLDGEATIDIKPYFYPTDSLTLDAKIFNIHEVAVVKDGQKKPLKYDYSDSLKLRIDLDRTYTRDEKYQIYVKYTAKPNEGKVGGSSAIMSDKGLYFINPDSSEVGKPTQIWTQGETEASSRWYPTIDAPNEKMTQEIFMTVPEEFKSLSNGTLMYSTDNGDGTRTDYWKQDLPHTPYLTMMAVGDFVIVKDTWKREDGSEMEVNYYVEPDYEDDAMAIFGETPRMIEYFSNLLGVEYPWAKYHQIVVRDYVSGAMENTTAVIHGDFVQKTKRELIDGHNQSIIAHELFHHWFGDLVTCESWANLPLNESFANYSQYLWDEYRFGKDEADYNAENEMQGYLLSSANQGYVNMIRYGYEDKEAMFDANSYNKGGRILHMLRKYLGDDAFFSSLEHYLETHKFKPVEIHDLRIAFEEVTGEDLNWFFNQWFLDKGHPQLEFTQEYDAATKTVRVTVIQQQNFEVVPLYKLPMKIDIYIDDEKTRYDVVFDEYEETVEFKVRGEPNLVNIDAEKMLLAEIDEEKPLKQYIFQYYNAPLYADRRQALEKCSKKKTEEAIQVIIDALHDDFWHLRVMAMNELRRPIRYRKDDIYPILMKLAKEDTVAGVRASAISTIYKYYKDKEDELMKNLYIPALQDSSYNVMASAMDAVSEIDPDKAYELAQQYQDEEGTILITTIGEIFAAKGGPEDHDFFKENARKVGGFDKIGFLKTYSRYLKKQDAEILFEGVPVYENMAANGGSMWAKYFGGYQEMIGFQKHFEEMEKAAETKIESLKAEGGAQSEITIQERKMEEAKKNKEKIKAIIDKLAEKETNQQVLNFLGK